MIGAATQRVTDSLKRLRIEPNIDEDTLHQRIKAQFRADGIGFEHEYVLGPRDRVDFLADGGIAVECKKGVPNGNALAKQIRRYCRHEDVRALVVVSPRIRHLDMGDTGNGKQVVLIGLNQLWGIATG